MKNHKYFKHLQSEKDIEEKESEHYLKNRYYNLSNTIQNLLNETININPDAMKKIDKNIQNIVSDICTDKITINSLSTILEHDYYTHTHSVNVSTYSVLFGKNLNLNKDELIELGCAGVLHDLGKSEININIITKKSNLTNIEFSEMKNHPIYGYKLAKKLGITNENILNTILQHHEKLDGSGYPNKLKSNNIHIYAKIISICDVFDALTTKRSYKNALKTLKALKIMKSEIYHFDNILLIKFIKMFRE